MKMLKFEAPVDDLGTPYWVPIVVKNKDWLVAFIYGYYTFSNQITSALNATELGIVFEITNLPINSMRFNDILPNGKDFSKLTKEESEEYITNLNADITKKIEVVHSENIGSKPYLTVECTCGLGFYSWNNENDIPNEDLTCANCGKFLIIYTNKNECEFYNSSLKKDG